MASTVITLNAFARASYVHLAEAYAHQQGDDAKYRLQAMFSKTNVAEVPDVGEIESHPYELIDALNEVCTKEFNFAINDIADVVALKDEVGVGFPPNFKDGDKVKKKDENGRPIAGSFDETTAGYWLLNLSSFDQIGVVDHEEDAIDPKKVYSGCWVRIQVEVSAYYNKSNSAIVNIEPLAVQYVYDDVQLGGGRPQRPDATKSFGKVDNGTAQTRDAKRMGKPGDKPTPPARPGAPTGDRPARPGAPTGDRPAPPSRPGAPSKPTPPSRPGAPSKPTPPAKPQKELVSISDYSIEELRTEYEMSDEQMVSDGYAEWQEVKTPAKPEPKKPLPPKKLPPKKPSGPKVVMNADSDYTYEELQAEGWTDEDIVNNGFGEFDYTDPDQ
ncbi:putative nucleic acid-binding, OB-fold protein [Vibrio phage 393E50-1]|nr:putative nucleic acid-binding, OB-fold protein [Vibrio phage 393E50-1]